MNIDEKAVEILNETLDKHEHRMAYPLFGSTEIMVLDAIKTAINCIPCCTEFCFNCSSETKNEIDSKNIVRCDNCGIKR